MKASLSVHSTAMLTSGVRILMVKFTLVFTPLLAVIEMTHRKIQSVFGWWHSPIPLKMCTFEIGGFNEHTHPQWAHLAELFTG